MELLMAPKDLELLKICRQKEVEMIEMVKRMNMF
jgi:hypothetical protein